MNDFIDIDDVGRTDIESIFETTTDLKRNPGAYTDALADRSLLMFFAKPSTRTRISFEAGMTQLGGHAIYFSEEQSQLSRGESLEDTGKVISRYTDAIMARLFEHDTMLALAESSDVPVVNGLTDLLHPCQALADIYTLEERNLDGPLAFVGDGNNVAHSLMQICATLDRECRVATPPGYEPAEEIVERVKDADVLVTNDPEEAVDGADAVYTDVFVSMGEAEEKKADFEGFQVTQELMDLASDDAVFMHCLPAHRGEEVAAEVIDGPQSVVYDEAENRQHVQKALLYELVAGD